MTWWFFFFQAEDGIRDLTVTGVQTCALPISAEDPVLVKRLAAGGITCEVCPSSNVALGVAAVPAQVPLRRLFEGGVPIALGADDPLLFGPRLAAQYEIARHAHGFTDAEL